MKRISAYLFACFLFISVNLIAQEINQPPVITDKVSLGIGLGQDYGGIGGHAIVYPHRNIGIFVGLGYNFNDFGYNVGLKLRVLPSKPTAKVTPYAIIMYGYNATIKVQDAEQLNKTFYGPTFGVGIDLKSHPTSKMYYSFGINLPFRGTQVDDYMTANNIELKTELLPITISLGIKFIIK
jgi:hypothetical protein